MIFFDFTMLFVYFLILTFFFFYCKTQRWFGLLRRVGGGGYHDINGNNYIALKWSEL